MAAGTKRSIDEITKSYGEHHEAEKQLKKEKVEFHEAANEILEGKVREQRTLEIPSGEDPVSFVDRWHPGWRLVHADEESAVIEEDPKYMPFVYFNEDDGKIYKRSVTPGAPFLDDDLLKEEYPDLWQRITIPDPVMMSTLEVFSMWAGGDIVRPLVKKFESQLPRVLKPMDDIEPHDRIALDEYKIPGPMEVKILAPRKVKPEEIEGAE